MLVAVMTDSPSRLIDAFSERERETERDREQAREREREPILRDDSRRQPWIRCRFNLLKIPFTNLDEGVGCTSFANVGKSPSYMIMICRNDECYCQIRRYMTDTSALSCLDIGFVNIVVVFLDSRKGAIPPYGHNDGRISLCDL